MIYRTLSRNDLTQGRSQAPMLVGNSEVSDKEAATPDNSLVISLQVLQASISDLFCTWPQIQLGFGFDCKNKRLLVSIPENAASLKVKSTQGVRGHICFQLTFIGIEKVSLFLWFAHLFWNNVQQGMVLPAVSPASEAMCKKLWNVWKLLQEATRLPTYILDPVHRSRTSGASSFLLEL